MLPTGGHLHIFFYPLEGNANKAKPPILFVYGHECNVFCGVTMYSQQYINQPPQWSTNTTCPVTHKVKRPFKKALYLTKNAWRRKKLEFIVHLPVLGNLVWIFGLVCPLWWIWFEYLVGMATFLRDAPAGVPRLALFGLRRTCSVEFCSCSDFSLILSVSVSPEGAFQTTVRFQIGRLKTVLNFFSAELPDNI